MPNHYESIRELFDQYVLPTYGRFEIALTRGQGCEVWDVNNRRYLDLGSGIAVCCLGHAHPEIADAIAAQARQLIHVSNLYYQEPQGRLAQRLVQHLAPGKMFFCNSGAEANEGLYKLARRHGQESGRFEIITALNSFHGRTLGGIAATGQDKIKQGFEPIIPGFTHVPYNNLDAVRQAITPATAAVLIEGVQGEGGITMAQPEYLTGLRQLCNEHNLLLLWDGVQCGHFRTGRFQSYHRILEDSPDANSFLPDALSMAKSLGNGFPIGAFWVRDNHAHLLQPGSHGTTYGGTPLASTVALKTLEIIERDQLANNARQLGQWLKNEIERLATSYPHIVKGARGTGFILGMELLPKNEIPRLNQSDKPAAIQMVNLLHQAGLLTIPAGPQVVRLLPPLNISRENASEAIHLIESTLQQLA